MDFERFDFDLIGSDAMSWRVQRVEDNTPIAKQAKKDRDSGKNGWYDGRKGRHIARLSVATIDAAEALGYDMDSLVGVYKFLADYPQYKTVPYIKSPSAGSAVSQGRVIIH